MKRRPLIRRLTNRSLLLAALVLCTGIAWLNFKSSSEFEGRYETAGTVLQKDGRVVDVIHTMQIKYGRFYAMTRQGNSILKTSGTVESGFANRLRLRVEKGEISNLSEVAQVDNQLLFNLMYSAEPGTIINLRPTGSCYLAIETRQRYCRRGSL